MKRKIDILFFVVKEEFFFFKYERIIVLEKRYGVFYGLVYSNWFIVLSLFYIYIYS